MDNRSLDQINHNTVVQASTHLKDHASGASVAGIIDSASGIRIADAAGSEIIDAFARRYCVNGAGCSSMVNSLG